MTAQEMCRNAVITEKGGASRMVGPGEQLTALQITSNLHNLTVHPCPMQANISDKTLAVTARHYDGTLEYNVHNLYGAYEVKATAEALRAIRNKRHFIFTRYTSSLRDH